MHFIPFISGDDEILKKGVKEYGALAKQLGLRETVVSLVVDRNYEKFLLVESSEAPGKYIFPQEGVEEGEDHQAACIRGLREELGPEFSAKTLEFIRDEDIEIDHQVFNEDREDFLGKYYSFYALRFTGSKSRIRANKREVLHYAWFTPDEARKLLACASPEKARMSLEALEEVLTLI